jgi:hypothetical protein
MCSIKYLIQSENRPSNAVVKIGLYTVYQPQVRIRSLKHEFCEILRVNLSFRAVVQGPPDSLQYWQKLHHSNHPLR